MYLSSMAKALVGQAAFKVLAKAKELERQGKNVLHFEIGEPDFDTPGNIKNAAIKALKKGETNYVNAAGVLELREAVSEEIKKTRGFKPSTDQVLIGPGANPMIYFALACVADRGDEILLPDPGFPSYLAAAAALGLKPVYVPLKEENDFRMNPDDVAELMTPKTRMIIMNSPQNPTGAVMTKDEVKGLADIAEDKKVYLFSDEIYSKLLYDEKHYTPAVRDECSERTLLIDGFSKAYAMTGWRLGYCVGPKELISKMELLLQTIVSCVPSFVQYGGVEALKGPQEFVSSMREDYRRRRDVVVPGLNKIPGFSCVYPQGAFYAFPNIRETGMKSDELADYLLEKAGVAVLPGTAFGPNGEGYLRFSYATSLEVIKEAFERITKLMEERGVE
ncbi:MAG TPA: pyridoxal phosphate-dependent aminotransferase [Thermoplasmatales archaeon]|nr:pyridoxal phosphate-dependent aminotransferase [Thermoplasmatales archaeon]